MPGGDRLGRLQLSASKKSMPLTASLLPITLPSDFSSLMPSRPLPKAAFPSREVPMKFPRISLPDELFRRMPFLPFAEMTLRSSEVLPPIVLLNESTKSTPCPLFPAAEPSLRRPMKLPATMMSSTPLSVDARSRSVDHRQ